MHKLLIGIAFCLGMSLILALKACGGGSDPVSLTPTTTIQESSSPVILASGAVRNGILQFSTETAQSIYGADVRLELSQLADPPESVHLGNITFTRLPQTAASDFTAYGSTLETALEQLDLQRAWNVPELEGSTLQLIDQSSTLPSAGTQLIYLNNPTQVTTQDLALMLATLQVDPKTADTIAERANQLLGAPDLISAEQLDPIPTLINTDFVDLGRGSLNTFDLAAILARIQVGPDATEMANRMNDLLGRPDLVGLENILVIPGEGIPGVSTVDLVVTNTADQGPGSLRDALFTAESQAGLQTIGFAIPTTDPGYDPTTGVYRIQPLSRLSTLFDPIVIDARTQPGYLNTPVIELNGDRAGLNANGLILAGGESQVRGLQISGFFDEDSTFAQAGIVIFSDRNAIENNVLGTAEHPNGAGIAILGSDNQIRNNQITGNRFNGLEIFPNSGDPVNYNRVQSNSIVDNGRLGIDLFLNVGERGVTLNDDQDQDTGPNGLQNFPVLESVTPTEVTGRLHSQPNAIYEVEFYLNDRCDASGFGEGQRFLGQISVATDPSGNASFTYSLPFTARLDQGITATATDAQSNTSEFCRCLRVPPSNPPSFEFTVEFIDNSLTPSQQARILEAAERWSRLITEDLPDEVVDLKTNACNDGIFPPAPINGTIDDIVLQITARSLLAGNLSDGQGGIVAQAGPCGRLRSGSALPTYGRIGFDPADIQDLENDAGALFEVALHEMAHVLGIGTLWNSSPRTLISSPSSLDPRYNGDQGVVEYNALGGVGNVPVQVDNLGHWRESSLGTELMTSTGGPVGQNFLSRITLATLQDFGFTTDLEAADPYGLPSTARLRVTPGISFQNDVVVGPLFFVDSDQSQLPN